MVRNDTRADLLNVLKRNGLSQSAFATLIGQTRQNLRQRLLCDAIRPSFVLYWEILGYDIELRYVRRDYKRKKKE